MAYTSNDPDVLTAKAAGFTTPLGTDPIPDGDDAITANAIRAAKLIDGLTPKVINATTDLDALPLDSTVQTAGNSQPSTYNYPVGAAGLVTTGRLVAGSTAHAVQTFTTDTGRSFVRRKTSGTWGVWSEIGKAALPTRYLGSTDDLDAMPLDTFAMTAGNSQGTASYHYPINAVGVVGTHSLIAGNTSHAVQTFTTDTGRYFVRRKANTWGAWSEVGGSTKLPAAYTGGDANTFAADTRVLSSSAFTNGPDGMKAGLIETFAIISGNANFLGQRATEWVYGATAPRMWLRQKSNATTWTPWSLVGGTSSPTSAGRSPSSLKTVRVPASAGHNPQGLPTLISGTARWALPWNFPVTRWRIVLQNLEIRSGQTATDGAEVTGVWVGKHDGNGGFTSAPTQAFGAFSIPDGGAECVTPWTTTPLPLAATGEALLSISYTSHNAAPWQQLWQGYTSTDATKGAQQAGTGFTAQAHMPWSLVIEVETYATTPVVAALTDSLGVGLKASRGVLDSPLHRYAQPRGIIPIHGGCSGDTASSYASNTSAPKWVRWTKGSAAPDAVLWALGTNDLGGGATADAVKARTTTGLKWVQENLCPLTFTQELLPRGGSGGWTDTHEGHRTAYNAWLATLPNGSRAMWRTAAAVSADGVNLDTPKDSGDHLHLTTAGYAAVASTYGVMTAPAPIYQ